MHWRVVIGALRRYKHFSTISSQKCTKTTILWASNFFLYGKKKVAELTSKYVKTLRDNLDDEMNAAAVNVTSSRRWINSRSVHINILELSRRFLTSGMLIQQLFFFRVSNVPHLPLPTSIRGKPTCVLKAIVINWGVGCQKGTSRFQCFRISCERTCPIKGFFLPPRGSNFKIPSNPWKTVFFRT